MEYCGAINRDELVIRNQLNGSQRHCSEQKKKKMPTSESYVLYDSIYNTVRVI